MTSLTEFFNKHEDDALKGISHKNSIIKRNIIAYMAVNGECTLSELTKELHISVPTITKLVQELVDENIVTDLGKVETPGGRRPNIFGLANSAIYFAGVNVGRDNMTFLITDLQNNIIKEEYDYTFELQDRPQCFERICSNIENFIATCGIDRGKILGLGVCMTGRVNPDTGRSYKYFTSSEQSLREVLEERVGLRVLLENDTRARCYAEYTCGKSKDESNVLYLHMGRGVAIGIVVDGQLYYGKSGFAGEFGHIPFFDNEIICSCGKKGCLETEVSGIAIEDKMCHLIEKGVNTILKEKYDQQKSIHIDDIIAAAKNDDNLSIELITDLQNNIIKEEYDYTFELQDRPQCFERICSNIENFIATCGIDRGKILGLGVCMTGRVNPDTGRSYKYFTSSEQSLREVLEERVGLRVLLENDTRARCYAEYTCGKSKDESNVLYLHMGRGVAIGIVVDGQLYYGKSGFAGEFGHIPFFDNEIICSCGKKGCLETEVSGIAIEDKMCHLIEKGVNTILKEKYDQQKSIHIDDIIAAAKNDDNLSIELIEEAGEKVGKAVAFLINTFNPETVIVGGNMAAAGDYIMLPLKSATNKYSLNLVYKDTKFRVSKMTENANAWGVAMLIRNKIIGI